MKKWIISNHKQGLEEDKLNDYIKNLENIDISNINFILCPNHNQLSSFTNLNYQLGSQDIVLPVEEMKNNSINYAIVGHRDTRINESETNEIINLKIKKLLTNNIIPILCVGEEENANPIEVVENELIEGLKDIENKKIIIAYEPNWAIGNDVIPKTDVINSVINKIKEIANNKNLDIIILYGGSVNSETISILEELKLDGYLIGRASLDINLLKGIIEVIK